MDSVFHISQEFNEGNFLYEHVSLLQNITMYLLQIHKFKPSSFA